MDLTKVILLALLQMCLHYTAVSSEVPQDQMPGPSHHRQRRGKIDKKDQKAFEKKDNLEWVVSSEVPKDAFFYYTESNQIQYIARKGCELYTSDGTTLSKVHHSFRLFKPNKPFKGDVEYLVNKDDFEILEWKVATYGDIPTSAVEFCKKMFVVKTEGGLGYIEGKAKNTKVRSLIKSVAQYEFLTLNHEIEEQYLSNNNFNLDPKKTDISQDLQVLREFTAENHNCNPIKVQAKLETTIEKTVSFQVSGSLMFGVSTAVGGKIPLLVEGKLTLSGQISLTLSRTSSKTEKTINSLTMETAVPPNHYCSLKMTGKNYKTKVEFTGDLTRIYKNKEIRRTSVSGVYSSQDVGDIKAIMDDCKPFKKPNNCQSKCQVDSYSEFYNNLCNKAGFHFPKLRPSVSKPKVTVARKSSLEHEEEKSL